MALDIDLTFQGDLTTGQQQQWTEEALSHIDAFFPLVLLVPRMELIVETVSEPPCAGHTEFACTVTPASGPIRMYLRVGLDYPPSSGPMAQQISGHVHEWFMECIAHEFAHAFTYRYLIKGDEEKERLCNMFLYNEGEGEARRGTLEDWNPSDKPWPEHIQEAVAEFFKDVYLLRGFRVYDNRTNWRFDRLFYTQWFDMIEAVTCHGGGVIS